MFLTHFNKDKNTYEVEISNNCMLYVWTDSEVRMDCNRTITYDRHFISGFVVDALAEYENTGLTPDEIKELQGDTLKKLKESNEILRKNNDEYFREYNKLLNENRKLKCILRDWLNQEDLDTLLEDK